MNRYKALSCARVFGVGVVLGGCAPKGTAQEEPTQQVLRVQRIELVDASGTVRARLNTEEDGTVMFRLFDQSGDIRVKLGASKQGSGLILANDTAQPGVHVLAQDTGSSIKLVADGKPEKLIEP